MSLASTSDVSSSDSSGRLASSLGTTFSLNVVIGDEVMTTWSEKEDSLNDALEMADDMSGGEMAPELADSAAEDAAEMGAAPVEPLQENDELEISEEMLEELVEKLTLDMGTSPAGFSSLGGAENSVMQANKLDLMARG